MSTLPGSTRATSVVRIEDLTRCQGVAPAPASGCRTSYTRSSACETAPPSPERSTPSDGSTRRSACAALARRPRRCPPCARGYRCCPPPRRTARSTRGPPGSATPCPDTPPGRPRHGPCTAATGCSAPRSTPPRCPDSCSAPHRSESTSAPTPSAGSAPRPSRRTFGPQHRSRSAPPPVRVVRPQRVTRQIERHVHTVRRQTPFRRRERPSSGSTACRVITEVLIVAVLAPIDVARRASQVRVERTNKAQRPIKLLPSNDGAPH